MFCGLVACGATPTAAPKHAVLSPASHEPCGGEEPNYAPGEPNREPANASDSKPRVKAPRGPVNPAATKVDDVTGTTKEQLCRRVANRIRDLLDAEDTDSETELEGYDAIRKRLTQEAAKHIIKACPEATRATVKCMLRARTIHGMIRCQPTDDTFDIHVVEE